MSTEEPREDADPLKRHVPRSAREVLNFDEPIAVMLIGILHHLTDAEDPNGIVRHLMDAVPPGSWLAINHPAAVVHPAIAEASARAWNDAGGTPPGALRTPEQIGALFGVLDVVAPGIVSCSRWCPDDTALRLPEVDAFCGVARKPACPGRSSASRTVRRISRHTARSSA